MTDLLIRDVPDDVLARIDANARRLGIPRAEYLRRTLAQAGTASGGRVGVGDLSRFGDTFADLADPEVMGRAWE